MSISDLLRRNPHPTREQIILGMDDNLCRCGAYVGITELFWTSGTFLYNVVFQQISLDLDLSVQRNLRSRVYDRGRYSAKRENGVHHFHSLLHEALT